MDISIFVWYLPVGRMMRLICSMFNNSGLRPPCIHKIFSSTIAATGKQLKQSVKVFHNLILYRLLPATRMNKGNGLHLIITIIFTHIRHRNRICD